MNDVSLDLWRGPHPRGDRPQRRRQVHADQPALGRPAAHQRAAIRLGGTDITGCSAERISRAGLGRSYQKTNIFLPFTVWENVRLAAQSRAQHAARWLRRATAFAATNERPNAPSNWPA